MSDNYYCISAKAEDLPVVISRKIKEGFEVHDEPVKVGNGVVVQMMVWRGDGSYQGESCESPYSKKYFKSPQKNI